MRPMAGRDGNTSAFTRRGKGGSSPTAPLPAPSSLPPTPPTPTSSALQPPRRTPRSDGTEALYRGEGATPPRSDSTIDHFFAATPVAGEPARFLGTGGGGGGGGSGGRERASSGPTSAASAAAATPPPLSHPASPFVVMVANQVAERCLASPAMVSAGARSSATSPALSLASSSRVSPPLGAPFARPAAARPTALHSAGGGGGGSSSSSSVSSSSASGGWVSIVRGKPRSSGPSPTSPLLPFTSPASKFALAQTPNAFTAPRGSDAAAAARLTALSAPLHLAVEQGGSASSLTSSTAHSLTSTPLRLARRGDAAAVALATGVREGGAGKDGEESTELAAAGAEAVGSSSSSSSSAMGPPSPLTFPPVHRLLPPSPTSALGGFSVLAGEPLLQQLEAQQAAHALYLQQQHQQLLLQQQQQQQQQAPFFGTLPLSPYFYAMQLQALQLSAFFHQQQQDAAAAQQLMQLQAVATGLASGMGGDIASAALFPAIPSDSGAPSSSASSRATSPLCPDAQEFVAGTSMLGRDSPVQVAWGGGGGGHAAAIASTDQHQPQPPPHALTAAGAGAGGAAGREGAKQPPPSATASPRKAKGAAAAAAAPLVAAGSSSATAALPPPPIPSAALSPAPLPLPQPKAVNVASLDLHTLQQLAESLEREIELQANGGEAAPSAAGGSSSSSTISPSLRGSLSSGTPSAAATPNLSALSGPTTPLRTSVSQHPLLAPFSQQKHCNTVVEVANSLACKGHAPRAFALLRAMAPGLYKCGEEGGASNLLTATGSAGPGWAASIILEVVQAEEAWTGRAYTPHLPARGTPFPALLRMAHAGLAHFSHHVPLCLASLRLAELCSFRSTVATLQGALPGAGVFNNSHGEVEQALQWAAWLAGGAGEAGEAGAGVAGAVASAAGQEHTGRARHAHLLAAALLPKVHAFQASGDISDLLACLLDSPWQCTLAPSSATPSPQPTLPAVTPAQALAAAGHLCALTEAALAAAPDLRPLLATSCTFAGGGGEHVSKILMDCALVHARAVTVTAALAQEAGRAHAALQLLCSPRALAPHHAPMTLNSFLFRAASACAGLRSHGLALGGRMSSLLAEASAKGTPAQAWRAQLMGARASLQCACFEEVHALCAALEDVVREASEGSRGAAALPGALPSPPPPSPRIFAGAISALQTSLLSTRDTGRANVLVELARALEAAGRVGEAEVHYEEALSLVGFAAGASAGAATSAASASAPTPTPTPSAQHSPFPPLPPRKRPAREDSKVWAATVWSALRAREYGTALARCEGALAAHSTSGRLWSLAAQAYSLVAALPGAQAGAGALPLASRPSSSSSDSGGEARALLAKLRPHATPDAVVLAGLAAVPKSGELWVEAARLLAGAGHVAEAVGCLRESARCTSQFGDVFSEWMRVEGGQQQQSGSVELLALAGQPNFGTQWTSFCAWPCWEGRDRTEDVLARIARALGREGGAAAFPTVAGLCARDLGGLRALERVNCLFGGDSLLF